MKTFHPILALTCLIILTLRPLVALASDVDNDLQSWMSITAQGTLHHKVKGYLEVQPRFSESADGLERLILRTAVGYQVTPQFSLWQGYAWTPRIEPTYLSEDRLYQQSTIEHTVKKVRLTHRTRLEELFLPDTSQTAFRLRHMLRATLPIDKAQKWAIVSYDEIFFNLNGVEPGPKGGFNQNRLFIGLSKTLNPSVQVEGGYISNFINLPPGLQNRINHVLYLGINTRF